MYVHGVGKRCAYALRSWWPPTLGATEFLSVGQAMVGLLKSADTVNSLGRLLLLSSFRPRACEQHLAVRFNVRNDREMASRSGLINMLTAATRSGVTLRYDGRND